MAKNEFKGVSSDTLLKMLANATNTYYNAIGHSKAHYNEMRMQNYTQELERRKVSVPDRKILSEMGQFNGEGSY
jgi:hypothetical protein